MRVKGVRGVIRWGYDTAATLNGWSVSPEKNGTFKLSATVAESNPFKVTQRPLTFVAPLQGAELRWSITTMVITNGTVTATLGKRET